MVINKEIDEILEERFFVNGDELNTLGHYNLCLVFRNTQIEIYWKKYWRKANHIGYGYMTSYLEYFPSDFEKEFLRLLIVEDFKQWLEENER